MSKVARLKPALTDVIPEIIVDVLPDPDNISKETCNTVNESSSKTTTGVICASCEKRITVCDSKMKTITCIHCNATSKGAQLKPALTDVIPEIIVDVLPDPDNISKETCNTVNESSIKKTTDVICASCEKRITVCDTKMKTITCIHCNATSKVTRLKPALPDVIPEIILDVLPDPDNISKETCNTVNESSSKTTTDVICASCQKRITVWDCKMKTITCTHYNATSKVARLKPALTDVIPKIAVDVLSDPEIMNRQSMINEVNRQKEKMYNVDKSKTKNDNADVKCKKDASTGCVKRKRRYVKVTTSKERMKKKRENLDDDAKNKIQQKNTKQHQNARNNLDDDAKKIIKEKDTKQHQAARNNLDDVGKKQNKQKNKEYQQSKRDNLDHVEKQADRIGAKKRMRELREKTEDEKIKLLKRFKE